MARVSSDLARLFSPDGPLARALPQYRERPGQVAMAEAVAETIAQNGLLIAEAGTGTGKTFAYLVPALLSGGRIIIATGTKTLQDQLFTRDLPRVREALRLPVTTALLKGRANYVCHYHLARARSAGRFTSREAIRHLDRISAFAEHSTTGDRAECTTVPENSTVWPMVTSTRENCLGTDCPHHKTCFVFKARREALAADVIVVNHHLLFADLALKDDGMGELLPACNAIIVDEAHRVPEVATQFFGERVSAAQLLDLCRDAEVVQRAAAPEAAGLADAIHAAGLATRQLRLALPAIPPRFTQEAVLAQTEAAEALAMLIAAVSTLGDELEAQAERDPLLPGLALRARNLAGTLSDWQDRGRDDLVRWCDVSPSGWTLAAAPLSVAPRMREQTEGQAQAWVFTSATLSAGGDFSLFRRQLGLENARAESWPSPFDYPNAGWIYVPENLPAPNSPAHTEAVIEQAAQLSALSGGRAFLLFTSLRAMRQCAEALPARLAARGLDFPVLVQNEEPKQELLRRFRASGRAILIGAQSFWEGVDVAGDALSLVLIDKLPFAPPDDPVLEARMRALEAEGGSPFTDWQLPATAVLLKQGAGRLIRSETDRGVLAICDDRIITKGYGRVLRKSLPPMPWTRKLADVAGFFSACTARELSR
ncbi:MAG: ATP-dependent DNA helicase [Casimicrobiaceae bacterium]